MFDGNDDTCWSSDQGSSQFVLINFRRNVNVSELRLMFQGGFVGQDAVIEIGSSPNELNRLMKLELINDSNDMQVFPLITDEICSIMKITFESSTDFYGRITLYCLLVYGEEVS